MEALPDAKNQRQSETHKSFVSTCSRRLLTRAPNIMLWFFLPSAVVGIGLTPEAIETSPVAYDLMMENTWRAGSGGQLADLDSWIQGYAARRYSGTLSPAVGEAWSILQRTVYGHDVPCAITKTGQW